MQFTFPDQSFLFRGRSVEGSCGDVVLYYYNHIYRRLAMHKSILRHCLISRTAKVAGSLIVFISVWPLLAAPPMDATAYGALAAWGDNTFGQSTVPAGLTGVTAIAGGEAHSLAVKSDGTVVAWGANDQGQSTVPAGLTGVTAIAAGLAHSVALKSDGTVVAWGAGATGTGCFPDCGQTMVPVGLTGVTAISAGRVHTVALKSDGTVVTWGAMGYDLGQNNIPTGLSGVKAISAGWYHNLALKTDGTVVAWGWNGFGQTDVPVGLSDVKAISAGFRFSAALKNDGTVVVWGGEGPQDVPAGLSNVTAIAANAYDIQALKSDGTVVAWGSNYIGAAQVPAGLTGVAVIAAGAAHTIALIGPSDTTAPTITITTPADGTTYLLGQSVAASYSCEDEAGGSDLASCSGTVASGEAIDTASVGLKTFTINAADNAGNTKSVQVSYRVIYNFTGFFQPVNNLPNLNIATAGSAIPVKFGLTGYQGLGIFAPGYPVSGQIACDANEPGSIIEETVNAGGSSLSYDASAGQYNYVWKTNKAWVGTCRILDVRFIDGTDHFAKFRFK
jgi:hypothetical protein